MDANFIVDTGAAVFSPVFEQIDANKRPALRDSAVRHFVVADNRRLVIEGVATLAFNAGEQPFQWDTVLRKALSLAVVTFLQQFRHYLLGTEFLVTTKNRLVRTNHRALRWVVTFKRTERSD